MELLFFCFAGEITANNKLVYNGTELHAIDKDSQILPFRHYEYMLIVVNGAGDAHSPWASVVTRQAPPTSVQSPSVTVSFVGSFYPLWILCDVMLDMHIFFSQQLHILYLVLFYG